MMGLDVNQHVLELVDRYRRPGQVIEHTIQANATLIDDAWAAFLAECPSYKAFFTHVDRPMRFMAGALRTGRLAEEVMACVAKVDARAATSD